jgi:hypothetical protein
MRASLLSKPVGVVALAVGCIGVACASASGVPEGDLRAYMHGIGVVGVPGGTSYVFFSSSGLPPKGAGRAGNWTHDVYVATWSPAQKNVSKPRVFVSRPEAQEPVSVAESESGNIMVTFEDGWNTPDTVSQRYGVYSQQLQPVKAYPLDVKSGGHSGHVAAAGERFVVFYSDDWVDGGGVDNFGTGKGVYLKVYDTNGHFLRALDVARGVREWWPLLAGSSSLVLLVWQAYVDGATSAELKAAIFDPATGRLEKPAVIAHRVRYYTYAVAYVPALHRFAVIASHVDGHGFIRLFDESGKETGALACMPETVREASVAVLGTRLLVPSRDGRLLTVKLGQSDATLESTMRSPIQWFSEGSVGLIRSSTSVHWVSLSPYGLQETDFNLTHADAPADRDRCSSKR